MTDVYQQDMAAFLYRLAGEPDYTPTSADKARFKDVNDQTPHAKEIYWLAASGISTGYLTARSNHSRPSCAKIWLRSFVALPR